MSDIEALGYVGLIGPRGPWIELAEILGLQTTTPSNPSEARFRMDDRAWRIAVEEGDPGIGYVGWEVASLAALERLIDTLTDAGFLGEPNPDLAQVRGVLNLLTCQDRLDCRWSSSTAPRTAVRGSPHRPAHGSSPATRDARSGSDTS
ncbi:MAG: hypothetical protein M3O28_00090 [Actinomycetota bacterium]|nr:hypothetical protein [Actinomycetota bacterium]